MIELKVKGFEHYLISKDGKVYNTRGSNGLLKNGPRELKSHPNKNTGYHSVVLRAKNLKPISKNVHRLVAEHFIPNPDNKPQVNHKDGNKSNNSVSNLEWMTHSENQRHARETGLHVNYNKIDNIRNNKKLLNKGLNHYKKYQNLKYLKQLWNLKSNYPVERILVENGFEAIKDRKYRKIPKHIEEEIKNYLKNVITKKQPKLFKNSFEYIGYIKKTYNIGFSFWVYRRIQLDVKMELFSNNQ